MGKVNGEHRWVLFDRVDEIQRQCTTDKNFAQATADNKLLLISKPWFLPSVASVVGILVKGVQSYFVPDSHRYHALSYPRARKFIDQRNSNSQTSIQVFGSQLADVLKEEPNTTQVKVIGLNKKDDVDKIVKPNYKVLYLDLSDCPELTDDILMALLQKFPNLNHLNLTGCVKLTKVGFRALFLNSRKFKSLNLTKCIGFTGFRLPLQLCESLTELDLPDCPQLEYKHLKALAVQFPNLIRLNLSGSLLCRAAIIAVVKILPKLKRLILSRCNNLTEKDFMNLRQNFPDLKVISQ